MGFFQDIDPFGGSIGDADEAGGDFFKSSDFLLLSGFAHGAQAKEQKDAASDRASAERAKAKARKLQFVAQQKQARAEQRIREVQERRARIKLLRETRRRQASIRTSAEATGVGTSTAAAGAGASLRAGASSAFGASRLVSGIQKGIVQSNLEFGTRAQSFLDIATEFSISAEEKEAKAGQIGSAIGIAGKYFGA